ncbi:MAG: hypothetical protein J5815_00490 [Clostridia bacterium]|nr:hypothetical protein [Clostridia bacterium]
MKNKRTLILIVVSVLLVALLTCTFTACLKIGMKAENIKKRLTEYGATVSYERSSPITVGWQSTSTRIKDIMLAQMPLDEEAVDGAELDVDADEEESEPVNPNVLYIFFCEDKDSMKWVKGKCDSYKSSDDNADLCADWSLYTYDDDYIVMFGHKDLLKVARQY